MADDKKMDYAQMRAHLRKGGKARRPHWFKHSYLFLDGRELWTHHRPYYPSLSFAAQRGYTPLDNDLTATDWVKYNG